MLASSLLSDALLDPATVAALSAERALHRTVLLSAPINPMNDTSRPGSSSGKGGPCGKMIEFTFDIDVAHAPAFKSIVDDMSFRIGTRLEQPHKFARETALTYAAMALGRLRAVVTAQVPMSDPNYDRPN